MALSSIFGGGSPSQQPTIPQTDPSNIKDKLKTQISHELAVANLTELVNAVTENCFKNCQKAPFNSQDNGCVDKCLVKYMRCWNIISQSYVERIQQTSSSGI
ncbi:HHR030Cp [Eremothecium sinecaudum]|uniref:Mitochondrial import inner membrane translocase subunit n=1 Tax=Eremothecium sinecaudum TaxID=45286 RepID=A0A0X8HWH0_9SACH|nr:HHR030Cp [Eremothecium sinecaudum]AMD22799.1 HHR030Cp [Eremothecium sinecaudum]